MNGKIIPDEQIKKLIELADWAPTHGRTEPWRFFVYTGAALKQFAIAHADIYWQHTPEDKRTTTAFENLQHTTDNVSHLIIATMKRGTNPKIPKLEEIAATSAAMDNILLGATALGISSFWSTGGMTHHPALKEHLQLSEEDLVMGLIYLGYSDEAAKEGKRQVPVTEKAIWK